MDDRVGEVYLSAEEIATRVAELGAEIAGDYAGREPLLVGSLKASVVFLADLTRALPILHHIDFVELAGYGSDQTGGSSAIRFLKDLDVGIEDRDVLIVEDVVDTGLTLHYLCKTFALRSPRSLAAVYVPRPPLPAPRRGPPGALCRLHRARRVLCRLRLRRRRALPQPARPTRAQAVGRWRPRTGPAPLFHHRYQAASAHLATKPISQSTSTIGGDDPQELEREPDSEEQGRKQQNCNQCKHGHRPLFAFAGVTVEYPPVAPARRNAGTTGSRAGLPPGR